MPKMVQFNCHDLESALRCDYLTAVGTVRKSDEVGKISGWEMEDLGKEDGQQGNPHIYELWTLAELFC